MRRELRLTGSARNPQLRNSTTRLDNAQGWQGPHPSRGRGSRLRDTSLAMSHEDVQRVREGLVASASGDPVAGQRFWDPAVEWDMSGVIGWAEKQVYRGPEVTEFLRAWADSWQGWHFDVEDVCDGDGEAVFAAIHEWATGPGSGASVDQRRSLRLHDA